MTVTVTVNRITMDAPQDWLKRGWADMMKTPHISILAGVVFVAAGLTMTVGLWVNGAPSVAPVAAAGFALIAPALAVGLYDVSRRLESGQERITISDVLLPRKEARSQLAFLSFMLMFLFLVWARIAQMLFFFFAHGEYGLSAFTNFLLNDPDGLTLITVGTAIGAVLAFVAFAMSAISFPFLLDKDVDVVTAVIASVNTIRQNTGPMLIWAWLIALLTGLGVLFAMVGLVLVFPLLGHATWHAYRDCITTKPLPQSSTATA